MVRNFALFLAELLGWNLSTVPRSSNQVFPYFFSFLTLVYTISLHFAGAWVAIVIHLTQWGVTVPCQQISQYSTRHNLGTGTYISPSRVISLQLLIQQQDVSLSHLVFSCFEAYQLGSTTKFLPPLQGCQQSLVMVSHSTIPLVPLRLYCVWEQIWWPHSIQGVATVFSPVLSISLSFYSIIFPHKQ